MSGVFGQVNQQSENSIVSVLFHRQTELPFVAVPCDFVKTSMLLKRDLFRSLCLLSVCLSVCLSIADEQKCVGISGGTSFSLLRKTHPQTSKGSNWKPRACHSKHERLSRTIQKRLYEWKAIGKLGRSFDWHHFCLTNSSPVQCRHVIHTFRSSFPPNMTWMNGKQKWTAVACMPNNESYLPLPTIVTNAPTQEHSQQNFNIHICLLEILAPRIGGISPTICGAVLFSAKLRFAHFEQKKTSV